MPQPFSLLGMKFARLDISIHAARAGSDGRKLAIFLISIHFYSFLFREYQPQKTALPAIYRVEVTLISIHAARMGSDSQDG